MTTKTITSNYYFGYSVVSGITTLDVQGKIIGPAGSAGAGNAAGNPGGAALISAFGAYVENQSTFGGGFGGQGDTGRASHSASHHGYTGYSGGAGGDGATLANGGSLNNTGLVAGGGGGTGGGGGQGYGSISAYTANGAGGTGGAGGAGVYLAKGSVTNQAAATIRGGVGGIGGAGVAGGGFLSVYSYNGSNGGAGGTGGVGVALPSATLTNLGAIAGGVGGTGGAGGAAGFSGSAGANGATGGVGDGVDVSGGGVIINGSPTNSTASISGFHGVYHLDASAPLTLTNYGSISGTYGVALEVYDALFNKFGGTIAASGAYVVSANGEVLIANDGFIHSTSTLSTAFAVQAYGGTLVNGSPSYPFAEIGGLNGVAESGVNPFTLINYGFIAVSDVAVKFSNAADRLIAENGSVIEGSVQGGGGVLELAGGAGTVYGLGGVGQSSGGVVMSFSGFAGYVVDKGASWTSVGTNTDPGGTLNVAGSLTNKGTLNIPLGEQGGVIVNQATIESAGAGLAMTGGTLTNGGAKYLTALLTGGAYGIYAGTSGTAVVVNYATILASGAGGSNQGVWIHAGSVHNGSASNHTALIKGVGGVYFESAAATLTNYGSIDGTGGVGVRFSAASQRLISEAGSKITGSISGGGGALELASGTGTVTGLGATGVVSGGQSMTFSGFGTYGLDVGTSWTLTAGNTVLAGRTLINAGTATVSGSLGISGSLLNTGRVVGAVGINGGQATNLGTVTGGVDIGGGSLANGSDAITSALISASNYGVYAGPSAPATIVNFATITETGASGQDTGVWMHGGSLTNGDATDAKALISGFRGVYLESQAATLKNFGTVDGTGGIGMRLDYAGQRLIAEAGSTIIGSVQGGGGTLELAPATGTLTGLGATGTVSGGMGLSFSGFGTYVTDGGAWTLAGPSALAHGQTFDTNGVVTLTGSLDNHGVVAGSEAAYATGVEMASGTTLTNEADGVISGYYAVDSHGAFTVANFGTIIGGTSNDGAGVNSDVPAGTSVLSLTNGSANDHAAIITGYQNAVFDFDPATVSNFGTLAATSGGGYAVALEQGVLTNGSASDAAAFIAGGVGVVQIAAATMTVTNFGEIEGASGTAVRFRSASDRLILESGSKVVGVAVGDGGALELGNGAGTLTGIGATGVAYGGIAATFSGFGVYDLDKGSTWTLTGSNTLTASQTLVNRGTMNDNSQPVVSGVLTNAGQITGGVSISNGIVSNLSTIGGGVDISLGRLTNGSATDKTAVIRGPNYGVYGGSSTPGTVINFGMIYGGNSGGFDAGVWLNGGGQVTNGTAADRTALITGSTGVLLYGPNSTLTNFGVIEGFGTAVKLGYSSDRLIVEGGSDIVGTVFGYGGTLELAGGGGVGTLSGLSKSFTAFETYVVDAGAAWTLTGFNAMQASSTFTNAGKLTVANTATLQVGAAVDNTGTITLSGASSNTDLRIFAGGVTFTGGGTVNMTGTKSRIIGATATSTLTNVDNTITGAGVIGANSMSLINQVKGVIDATGASGLAVATKGETLVNAGLMEATGGGILAITNTTVINTGTLLATNLSPVKLQNVVVRGGSIIATGSGVIKFNVSGGELDGTASAVSLSGVTFIVNGSNETLEGSIANAGKINLIASTSTSDLIIGAAGATLSGGGQVNMTNSLSDRIYGLASGDTLTNVDNRIDGAGLIGNGVMTLINDAKGQIVGNQNFALTIDTGVNTIVNAGLIENVGKGGTLVKSAVANAGTLLAATAGTLTLAGAVTGAGIGQIAGGTLYVQQAFAENVTFSGSTGVLELGDSQAFTGTVTGLSKTGTSWLDLVDIGFFAAKTKATYSGTTASGTLTVTDGTHTAHIAMQGNYLAATWTLSGDGHGGTKVVDPSAGAAPLAQALASFQAGPAPGQNTWIPQSAPRLLLAHTQT